MKIEKDYNLASETFFGVGGKADFFVELNEEDDFEQIKKVIEDFSTKEKLIVGACSNILISDEGFDGIIIKNSIKGVLIDGTKVKIGAGEMLPQVAMTLSKNGLEGFEHLGNIPGTIGGGIRGNVEAYRQTISDNLIEVEWCDFEKGCQTILNDQCEFEYRGSIFKNELNNKGIIISASFDLKKGNSDALLETIKEDRKKRMESQPTDRSCGCFFKNIVLTENNIQNLNNKFGNEFVGERKVGNRFSAGMLIDEVGLKGESVGGAKVSEKHANFLINYSNASSQDIYDLYKFVKKRVFESVGIELENEVMIVGDFKE